MSLTPSPDPTTLDATRIRVQQATAEPTNECRDAGVHGRSRGTPTHSLETQLNKQEFIIVRGVGLLAALVAAGAAHAQSGTSVTLYGIADAGVELSNAGRGTVKRQISGSQFGSRWGLTGSEDLGGGWRAVFRLENGFNIDEGTLGQGGRIFGREASVGLSSASLGTVTAGRIPTPYYLGTVAMDAFGYGHAGGYAAITRSGAATRQVMPQLINARNDNAVNYTSPKLGGLELRLQVAAGEGSTTLGRAYSASARYAAGPVDAVLAYAQQNGAGNDGGKARAASVGGSYNFGMARLFAAYVSEKNECSTCTGALARVVGVGGDDASEFRVASVGVRVPFSTGLTGIAQVARVSDRSEYAVDPGDRDATWVAIGAEYAFSKRTTLYTSAGTISNSNGSQYALGNGGAQQPAGSVGTGDPRAKTFAVGMRHSF